MDPALGGVKSRETRARHLVASRERVEEDLSFGLYSGMKHRHPESSFFRYLRRLRSDGRTNMYGAIPYLMKAFDLDRAAAFDVVCAWLDRESDLQKVEPERGVGRRSLPAASRS